MSYYHSTILKDKNFEAAIEHVTAGLKQEGFGVLTTIDMKSTMKAKLDKDIAPYTILGACNPPAAFKALQAEEHIGTMLPCNVIVRQIEAGIEVAAVDPIASMQAIQNEELGEVATEINEKLKKVISSL
jgi:uncharacterized protein (DUF302 family)